MKCSPYRKRYILIQVVNRQQGDFLVKNLGKIFHVKEKYRDQKHSIILTDQFLKDQVCLQIQKNGDSAMVITVSGTIKKCKKMMQAPV
ncbi:MAG: hypothetical protein M1535_02300 [Candidatus Thermoplasmatota archaeon]|jgi:hypothetical protein|nr:hypothetical protein [Candidatus Thermoplasmatota archaeon]